jgi:acetate kinase
MTQACLGVLNAGSSSIKFAVYDRCEDLPLRLHGKIEAIGVEPRLTVSDRAGRVLAERRWPASELDHE